MVGYVFNYSSYWFTKVKHNLTLHLQNESYSSSADKSQADKSYFTCPQFVTVVGMLRIAFFSS